MSSIRVRPEILSDSRFRDQVRDLLVELPNTVPGLGLKVSGPRNVVVVFPRAGRAISTKGDLLALTWYSVDVSEPAKALTFTPIPAEAIDTFLDGLRESPER